MVNQYDKEALKEARGKEIRSTARLIDNIRDYESPELTDQVISLLESFSEEEHTYTVRRAIDWLDENYDDQIIEKYVSVSEHCLDYDHSQSEFLANRLAEVTERLTFRHAGEDALNRFFEVIETVDSEGCYEFLRNIEEKIEEEKQERNESTKSSAPYS